MWVLIGFYKPNNNKTDQSSIQGKILIQRNSYEDFEYW